VSANGVESYRQRSPKNAVEMAEVLLDGGAEVDAEAEVYGGGCTTLELVATSTPPRVAGVQLPLLETLLARRASMGDEARARVLLRSCLANGQADAARYLAGRGAPLDLATAAGLGRLEAVAAFFSSAGGPGPDPAELAQALVWACFYAPPELAALLLDHGVPIAAADRYGQTGLHCAAMARRPELARLLLARGAPLEALNAYGGTPLGQALWSAAHSAEPDGALEVLGVLVEAGARLPEGLEAVSPRIDALLGSAR
jgi:ankyrin repeat protein